MVNNTTYLEHNRTHRNSYYNIPNTGHERLDTVKFVNVIVIRPGITLPYNNLEKSYTKPPYTLTVTMSAHELKTQLSIVSFLAAM